MEIPARCPGVGTRGGKTEEGCEKPEQKPMLLPFVRECQTTTERHENKSSGIFRPESRLAAG